MNNNEIVYEPYVALFYRVHWYKRPDKNGHSASFKSLDDAKALADGLFMDGSAHSILVREVRYE